MKKYLKTPRVLRRATLLAMLPVFFLAGCGQKTECEKSIDTAMGTVISQTVYVTGNSVTTTNSKINEKITDVLLQKLNDLEQKRTFLETGKCGSGADQCSRWRRADLRISCDG